MKAMATTILQKKVLVRKEMNSIVQSLSEPEVLRQSDIVVTRVINHPVYKAANSISIYLSFDKEINTQVLVEDIFRSGKRCFIPRFRKGLPDMEMVKLHSFDDYINLPVNKWNIKQPSDEEKRESVFDTGSLDLVIAPGLAFTEDGSRLGRGKGYYDKFLSKCSKEFERNPFTLALAFNEQIIGVIPSTDTDIKMDEVMFADKITQLL